MKPDPINAPPADAAARRAASPVICYPVATLPRPDLAAYRALRDGLQLVETVVVPPREAETWSVPAGHFCRIVSIEDHAQTGGFGSALLELVADHAPGVRVRRLGLPDRFIDHGDTDAQWRTAGIDADGIAAAARALLEPRRA